MLCTGVVLGSFMDIKTQVNSNTGSYYQINEKQNSYKVVSTTDIAVVNLDEGVNLREKKAYYAGKIITLPNEHFHMTSLDDARNGLKSGEYGAYIVIPATFSKAVESINNEPEKATIKYTVNADNNDSSLASIVNDINSFAVSISHFAVEKSNLSVDIANCSFISSLISIKVYPISSPNCFNKTCISPFCACDNFFTGITLIGKWFKYSSNFSFIPG